MPFTLDDKLVIALASSALFDLSESDAVFRTHGDDAYRRYQREKESEVLKPGVAYPFIRRLLSLNQKSEQVVEVFLLSRNDPDTGLRVFNSVEHYGLGITRGAFTCGAKPYKYMGAFNAKLFLSANKTDVEDAVNAGFPAGQVLGSMFSDDSQDPELRIAFDFDGVLAGDEAEQVFQNSGLAAFHQHENKHADTPLSNGPLYELLKGVAKLQESERELLRKNPAHKLRIRTAIVTARNAPAHKRMITSLREWNITIDEAFFLGGLEKKAVLELFRPHIFFDDQSKHLEAVAGLIPCVHVPFGKINEHPAPGAK